MSPCLSAAAILLGVLVAVGDPVSAAQEDPPRASSTEDFERADSLARELAALLLTLPPEQRTELLALLESLTAESEDVAVAESGAIPAVTEEAGTGTSAISSEQPSPADLPAPERSVPPPLSPDSGPREPSTTQTGIEPDCGNLAILDSNADGWVSGGDRFWRHLRLWRDDGDGTIERNEVKTLFDRGIRRLNTRLTSYITSKDREGGVWVEDVIYLDILGKRGRDVLIADAEALARGGEIWLEDESGRRIEQLQPLTVGLRWRTAEGTSVRVLCR